MAKLPAIMLYPADWLLDEVSGCSLAAQGLWLRLMFLMHSSSRYGYLVNADGSAIPHDALARRCGCTAEQFESLITELDGIDKMGRTEEAIRFSRRMVRDEQKRSNDRIRMGRHREKGGGDPAHWTAIRVPILDRDTEMCAYCGKHAVTVDHIVPKSKGGTEDSWNLVACCKSCNFRKGNRTPKQADMDLWRGFDTSPISSHPLAHEVFKTPLETPTATPRATPKSRGITATVSSSNKNPSGLPVEESLHVKCRELVHVYWQRFHPGDELAPWDGHVGKKLAVFLSANPRLTEAGFKRLLDCRADSDVNHSDPPADWIPKLIKFGSGPLDRYGKPMQAVKPTLPQLRGVTLEEAMQR